MRLAPLLIANRGEIALRILRTARRLGLRTIAVHSDADREAAHVRAADEAVRIGPAAPAESYLCIDALMDAARATGAHAVHPGYGFLSENPDFAEACERAGLVFVGPGSEAIRLMGDKARAKRRMVEAGVPCIPGYDGENGSASDEALTAAAPLVGFPLMIKAAAGGGGRGMRRVAAPTDLPAALASARNEARAAFGDDRLILERQIVGARHVEIQVVADAHGRVLHLGERDCSIQRRHQKVIEECPSPALSASLRERMGAAAVRVAAAAGYRGVGTVEFLLDDSGHFWFMEMNTRLQVEHAVTEAVTGLDLVEMQLRIAGGEPLALRQEDVRFDGHAIEARLCAEDPERGFLPRTGTLARWRVPAAESVRVDHALEDGAAVTSHYDPLLAKLIAHGATREQARARLLRALRGTVALGVGTNKAFLVGCLEHPEFFAGRANTDFVAAHFVPSSPAEPEAEALAAAALLLARLRWIARMPQPWLAGWHSAGIARWRMSLALAERVLEVAIRPLDGGRLAVDTPAGTVAVDAITQHADALALEIAGRRLDVPYALGPDGTLHLEVLGRHLSCTEARRSRRAAAGPGATSGIVAAPMSGRVLEVRVAAGARVRAGDTLAVMESMKMEHPLLSPCEGRVAELACEAGTTVAAGAVLFRIERAPAPPPE